MENRLNSDYIERIILKGFLSDKNFLTLISSVFVSEYFDDPNIRHAFTFCKNYLTEYNSIPPKDAIINSSEKIDEIKEVIEEAEHSDFDVSQSYDFLLDQTNDYLKEKALKRAIVDSVDDVENPDRRNAIRDRIEKALIKDIKIDLGLKYFEDIGARLRRIFTVSEKRVPTYYPVFDELISGGFPNLTFSVFLAKIHGGKSNTMANFAARQVFMGHNVVVISMEMSEDAFAQRFDSIYSGLDINRMYISDEYRRRLVHKLKETRDNRRTLELDEDGNQKEDGRKGELLIKNYPTGSASVMDFRVYLRELALRNIKIDIIYVDYINIMKSEYKSNSSENLYSANKRVAEELRALSFEFECPVVSVSQINRQGFYIQFDQLDLSHVAESMGIPATADFMAILGTDEDQMVYENEVLFKILKSRIGRMGLVDRFYLDKRSLKMYDSSEEEMWIDDATESGDSRAQVDREELDNRRRNNRRDRDRD